MRRDTSILLDLVLLLVFCAFLFLTLDVLPTMWAFLEIFLDINVEYLPCFFINSILLFILAYTVIVKKQKNFLAYAWFLILAVLFYVAYDEIENPYDKMHLFEYFALSFLFFRLLRHYMFNVWLYPVCAMLTMVVAITDESLQIFTSHRHFSFSDLGADFISALLGQISIALTIRPTLESYRYTLRRKKRHFLDEKRWLKKTTKKA